MNHIESVKASIKATVPKRKKRTTAVWKDFVESYKKDLEVCIQLTTYYNNKLMLHFRHISHKNKEK